MVGLALQHTLSVSELERALRQAPVRLRVAYFAAGNWRGTWTEASPVTGEDALQKLRVTVDGTVKDAQVSTRRNAMQIIGDKSLERVLGDAVTAQSALTQLSASSSLRLGVLGVVQEHQAWADARAVGREECGFISGLQVSGTPAEVQAFAEAVAASGFTFDRSELFNIPAVALPLPQPRLGNAGTLAEGKLGHRPQLRQAARQAI